MTATTYRFERLARIVTALALLAAIGVFVRGWLVNEMTARIPWDQDGARRALMLSAGYWAVVAAIAATGRRALTLKLAVVATLALVLVAGVVPVAAAALVFASACALGFGILSRNRRVARATADLPLCMALGLGIIGTVLGIMALKPINTPLTWLVVLAIPLAWQGRGVLEHLAGALRFDTNDFAVRDLLLLGLLGNVVLLHVVFALLPEVGNDALALHLLVASQVRDFGAWHYDVQRNLAAVTPLSVDFLYTAGYLFGGEAAARLVNAGSLLALLALVGTTVRALAPRRAAILAMVVAAATPLAALETASLFVDNTWALLVVASLVGFLQFAREGESVRLLAGGIAFGGALAAKAITIAALPAALLILALAWREHREVFPWRTLGTAILAGLAVALPPYLIALAKTGNPVFPLFNALFRSPLFPVTNYVVYPAVLDPLLLYRMTFHSGRYFEGLPGSLGFTFLLLLPALVPAALRWGRREGAAMLFAILAFAPIVVANTAYLRYLYPCVFLLAIVVGVTLPALESRDALLAGGLKLVALGAVAANLLFLPAGYAPIRSFDLAATLEAGAREAHVAKWAPARLMVPLLNALPASYGPVAFLGAPPYLAELRRTAFVDSAYMRAFLGRSAALRSETDLARLVREFGLGLLLVAKQSGVPAVPASIATPLASAGDLTLYAVTEEARYQVERLGGRGFEVAPGAWVRHGDVRPGAESGTIVVSAADLLYQAVPVAGSVAYRYAVESRCHNGPAEVRLQLIWHVRGGGTRVHARTVACTSEWTEARDIVVAPADALLAVVYATGHGSEPVALRRVSFRAPN